MSDTTADQDPINVTTLTVTGPIAEPGAWKYRYSVKKIRFSTGERFPLLYDSRTLLPDSWVTRFTLAYRSTTRWPRRAKRPAPTHR